MTLCTAEGLDKDKTINLRPNIVVEFYKTLETSYEGTPYDPNKIWNCDETGIQAGRNGTMRVLACQGSRNVFDIIPKIKEWITILCFVNASSQTIPGFYLFKGNTKIENYIVNYEPHATMATQAHA